MKTVRVKPGDGRTVLMPDRNFEPVPAEGVTVPLDSYYGRALGRGDLVEVKDDVSSETKAINESAIESAIRAEREARLGITSVPVETPQPEAEDDTVTERENGKPAARSKSTK
jgi:hypothetical protein